jgi:hypothetical protein
MLAQRSTRRHRNARPSNASFRLASLLRAKTKVRLTTSAFSPSTERPCQREVVGGATILHEAARVAWPGDPSLFLTMHIHLAYGAGARRGNGMSGYEVQADANLLSAFALMIGGAVGVAFPMTVVIIWICSWARFDVGALPPYFFLRSTPLLAR